MLAALLALIAEISPALSTASAIGSVITTLENIVGTVTSEVTAVLPMIKNIIAALQGNGNVTPDQMAALTALDAATDAAFEQAAAADGAAPDPAVTLVPAQDPSTT